MQQYYKTFIVAGIILLLTGMILWIGGNKLNWIGKLPGDIRIEKENFRFYMPLTTMILFSVVVSFIIWLIRKFNG